MKIEFEIKNALEWSELKLALEQRLMHVIDVYGEENPTADAIKEFINEFTTQSYGRIIRINQEDR